MFNKCDREPEQFEEELPSRLLSLICVIIAVIHFANSGWKDEGLTVWLERIAKGEEVHPCVAASLLQSALSERPNEFTSLTNEILGAVGVGAAYSWGWYSSVSYHEAILKIGRLVSDDALWRLVSAAVKYADSGSAWTQGISRNLYCVLLSRAAKQGAPELRTGLACMLTMHERWLRGGKYDLELPAIKIQPVERIESWAELAVRTLTFLLASRSAEVLESALVGIHAISNHEPNSVGIFLKTADGDLWKKHWILNAAEVWAALHPKELEKSQSLLAAWLTAGPLHLRLQAWIVLGQLTKKTGMPLPAFPHPAPGEDQEHNHLHLPARQIMVTPVKKHGSLRFVDNYNSIQALAADDKRLQDAHHRAVRIAVAELQHFAGTRVHQGREISERLTGNVICATFQHDTSRALDPHLHTHCVMFNATFDAVENRWKALSNYEMLQARKYAITSYGSQGKTVEHVLFSDSTVRAATNNQQWLVTISRGTRAVKIFTSDKDQLRENVSRLGDRELAIEFSKQDSKQRMPVPVRKYINGLIEIRRSPMVQIPIEKVDLWKPNLTQRQTQRMSARRI